MPIWAPCFQGSATQPEQGYLYMEGDSGCDGMSKWYVPFHKEGDWYSCPSDYKCQDILSVLTQVLLQITC